MFQMKVTTWQAACYISWFPSNIASRALLQFCFLRSVELGSRTKSTDDLCTFVQATVLPRHTFRPGAEQVRPV